MPDSKDIRNQQELLLSYRRTLAHHLHQLAILGVGYIPPGVTHGIEDARANIRRIKDILRSWGVACEDAPDDEASRPTAVAHPQRSARGIPRELLKAMTQALLACDEFQNHAHLRAMFGVEELRPWQAGLPESANLRSRVDLTIDYLGDRRRNDGRHALALLFGVLIERYDPEDARHKQLTDVASRLENLHSS